MADTKPQANDSSASTSLPRMYSPSLQPLLQLLLATLATIDGEYERECGKHRDRTMDVELKMRLLAKLQQQHRERREPYIQQLAVLQDRIWQGMQ
jgi:hypothetical protein